MKHCFRHLFGAITRALQSQFGYTVRAVTWQATHTSWTRQEALEWVECYPAGETILIGCRGRLVAGRLGYGV